MPLLKRNQPTVKAMKMQEKTVTVRQATTTRMVIVLMAARVITRMMAMVRSSQRTEKRQTTGRRATSPRMERMASLTTGRRTGSQLIMETRGSLTMATRESQLMDTEGVKMYVSSVGGRC